MRTLVLFVLFFQVSFVRSKAMALSWIEYQGVKSIASSITKTYPPDQYIYIGIGASPTAIIAYIEAIFGQSQVIHLPLSNTSKNRLKDLDTPEKRNNFETQLKLHFDYFLKSTKIGSKKILLIDYVNTGEGLIYVFDKVSEYLQAKGIPQSVEALGLAKNLSVQERLKIHNIDSLILNWFIKDRFLDQRFDEYRKYDSYRPSLKTDSFYFPPHLITNQLQAERLADFYRRSGYKDVDLRKLRSDPAIHKNLKTYPNLMKEMDTRIQGDPLLKLFSHPEVKKRGNPLAPYCRQLFFFPN